MRNGLNCMSPTYLIRATYSFGKFYPCTHFFKITLLMIDEVNCTFLYYDLYRAMGNSDGLKIAIYLI